MLLTNAINSMPKRLDQTEYHQRLKTKLQNHFILINIFLKIRSIE